MRLLRLRYALIVLLGGLLLLNFGCSQNAGPDGAGTMAKSDGSARYRAADAKPDSKPVGNTALPGATAERSEAASSGLHREMKAVEGEVAAEHAASAEEAPAVAAPRSDAPEDSAGAPSPTSPPARGEDHPKPREAEKDAEESAPPAKLRRDIQSGLLTAGSFDDVEKFDSYQDFLTKTLQQDAGERFPRWTVGQRVTIQVRNAQGLPVGNARIQIRPVAEQDVTEAAQQPAKEQPVDNTEVKPGDSRYVCRPDMNGPALTQLITGSDGRALLLTGLDKIAGRKEVAVCVSAANQETITSLGRLDEANWEIVLPDASGNLPSKLDLALVIDTTGSMGDELEYLKVEIDSIAASVRKMFPGVDQRFALIAYRDDGDQYVTRTFDFASLADFRSTLAGQSADGGGDYPEAMHLAVEQAGQLSWREGDTARVMFLVGDAPPHAEYAQRTLDAGLKLRSQGVRIYPLGASGVALEAEFLMRAIAFASVGQYLFLTDHSGIGNAHATPHVPEFQVERLDRLMIRMIAAELAGKRLAPQEVIAIERGDGPRQEGLPPEPQQEQSGWHLPAVNSAWAALGGVPRFLLLGSLVLGVCLFDGWEKRRRR